MVASVTPIREQNCCTNKSSVPEFPSPTPLWCAPIPIAYILPPPFRSKFNPACCKLRSRKRLRLYQFVTVQFSFSFMPVPFPPLFDRPFFRFRLKRTKVFAFCGERKVNATALLDFNNNAIMRFGLMELCTLIANSKSILASGHPPCK